MSEQALPEKPGEAKRNCPERQCVMASEQQSLNSQADTCTYTSRLEEVWTTAYVGRSMPDLERVTKSYLARV